MFDLATTPEDMLRPIDRVLTSVLASSPGLGPNQVMVVGAVCRDILHGALGHTFSTSATHDLDLALALSSWAAFLDLTAKFPR